MKSTFLFLSTASIILISLLNSCSQSDNEIPETTPSFTFSTLAFYDRENQNNSGDILLKYVLTSDIAPIDEMRLIVSTSQLTLEDALNLSSESYSVIEKLDSRDSHLSSDLEDLDGNPIIEEVDYQVYILGIFQNSEFSPVLTPAQTITLKNEVVVVTPTITGEYNAMEDLVIANDGTLYINGGGFGATTQLFKITTEGRSTVISNGLNGAVGIALDAEGNVYSSNFNNTTINKITPDGQTSAFITDNLLVGGGGLAFDQSGNLFNAFAAVQKVFRISNGNVEEFSSSTLIHSPIGLTFGSSDSDLYVSSFTTGQIFHINEQGEPTLITDTPVSIGHMAYSNDHLFVTGWNEHQVLKVSLDGTIIATYGTGTAGDLDGTIDQATFNQPNGIDVTPDGKHVFVSQGSLILRKIILDRPE
ncbi:MAG: hypothetical protein JXR07_01725 [Reichenbachiella sp.]